MTTKKIDNICAMAQSLIDFTQTQEIPPLIFAGTGSMWANAPAPYLEITLINEGGYDEVRMGDETHTAHAGEVVITNVHFGNMGQPVMGGRAWCCFMDYSAFPEFDYLNERPLFLKRKLADKYPVIQALKLLAQRARNAQAIAIYYPPPGDFDMQTCHAAIPRYNTLLIKNAFLDVLALIVRDCEAPVEISDSTPSAVRRAVEYMEIYYDKPETNLGELAKVSGLTIDHFGRLFKSNIGTTPMKHLQAIRVGNAMKLLRYTNMKIKDIAHAVGFEDQYYFSKVFRQHHKISPKQYRQIATQS